MPHKVFVSSTFLDLEKHRARVIGSLQKSGFVVDPMEFWTASKDEPKVFSQKRIDGCDLCIALIGFRRGYVPAGEKLSITQLEIQAAVSQNIDVLVFMLAEDAPWPRKYDEMNTDAALRRWRNELRKRYGAEEFGLESASIDVAPALHRWIAEREDLLANKDRLVALQPALTELKNLLAPGTTTEILRELRDLTMAKVAAIGGGNIEIGDRPPMDVLRECLAEKVIDERAFVDLEYAISISSEILYEQTVSTDETLAAIEHVASAFHRLDARDSKSPHFKVQIGKNGRQHFNFYVDGKVLLRSDHYTSEGAALNGIRAARRVAKDGLIEKCFARDGRPFLRLVAGNREIIATSKVYDPDADLDRHLQSIRSLAPKAPTIG